MTEAQTIPDELRVELAAPYVRQNFESGEPWSATVARAILDERERCARLMEDEGEWTFCGTREAIAIFQDVRELAADAIRNPEKKA